MPPITNWSRENRTPTLEYRNRETGARAVLHRAPDSYVYKWRAAILVDGYPIWSRGFETKDAKQFRDTLRERPTPDLTYQHGARIIEMYRSVPERVDSGTDEGQELIAAALATLVDDGTLDVVEQDGTTYYRLAKE